MSERTSSPSRVVPFLAAGTTFFTLLTWDGLSDDSSAYLVPLFWICLGVAALGLALRALRLSRVLVLLVQTAVTVLVVHQYWSVGGALGGWIPTSASLAEVGALMRSAVETTARYAAPIPTTGEDFAALMLAIGAAIVLLVDFLACTLRRVPLAGLPLLATFTAPVSILGGVSWLAFVLAAICFVLLLAADQASRLGHWGHSLTGPVEDSQPRTVGLDTVWPTATRIGVAGIGLAVLAPALLPATDGLFGRDGGPGTGSGDDEVNISNPMLDVRRDLRRGEDIDLLRFSTDDPDPRYLRISVLDEFNGAEWRPSDRDIPIINQVAGPMPPPPGLRSETERTPHTWSISVGDALKSEWLPVPYPATNVEVNGDWRSDPRTLDLLSPDATTAGLTYEVTAAAVRADPDVLVSAPPADRSVFVDGTRLPLSVPSWLEALARDVTDGSRSTFERAVMLQQWFRVDGGFEYSVARSDVGNGTEQLELFLGTQEGSRVGYCEQFAAGMALMARTLGIPARVAVGFLRPEQDGDTWVYSSHDLHAWPELYFEGAGWLRFEPTPASEDVEAPGYTTGSLPAPEDLSSPSASVETNRPTPAAVPDRPEELGSSPDEGVDVLRIVGWAALALGAVALVALPRALRGWQRSRRRAGGGPGGVAEGAWAEVRATALDLGLGWDDGATLRRRAQALVPALGPSSHGHDGTAAEHEVPATEALERLVLLLERARFSRSGLPEAAENEIFGLAETVTAALHRGAQPGARRRATWLPASLWRGRYVGPGRRDAGPVDRMGELDRVSL